MTTSPRADRLARARKEMADRGVQAVLVGPSADFRYLTGYLPPGLERLTLLVVPADGQARLVAPALEAPLAAEHLGGLDVEVLAWQETDDPFALVHDALAAAGAAGGRLAVGDQLWSAFLLRLQAALPAAAFTLASTITGPLRMVKDPEEIQALARVAAAVDRVVVDIGGRLDGYGSDTTRTVVVGEPPAGFLEAYEAVQAAQLAGCAAA